MFIHVRYPNSIGKFLPSSLLLLQGNVLLGGFGTDGSSAAAGPGAKGRQDVSEVSAMGFVGMLFGAPGLPADFVIFLMGVIFRFRRPKKEGEFFFWMIEHDI